MTNRWQVRVHQSHTNGAKSPKCRWVVDPPGFDYIKRAEHTSNWHRAGGKWFQWGRKVTKREAWEQALAYADRMGRTARVELPRVRGRTKLTSHNGEPDGHPTGYTLIPRDKKYSSAMTIVGPWGTAGIFDEQDLEPLALALLAHARKEQP